MKITRQGFMCLVTLQDELGHAGGELAIYSTIAALKKATPQCAVECGVARVTVTMEELCQMKKKEGKTT